jgi:cold shock CspA family protein
MSSEIPNSPEPSPETSQKPAEEVSDKFRQGKIIKFFPHSSYGFVRDQNGKEIYFHLDEIRFVGEKRDRSHLVEGARVGIDVGRTARGLRVTRLKIY